MNRQIEFRAKNEDGKWVYGFYSQFHNRPVVDEPNSHQIFEVLSDEKSIRLMGTSIGGIWHIIDKNTLGQYVGLKDKNGTKIYEGDVVRVKRTYCNSGESELALYSVCWKESWCSWALDRVDIGIIQSCRLEPTETYEIVGNIYDEFFYMSK